MLISSVVNIKSDNLFFQCLDFLENGNVLLKLEGLNVAGSIKLKTALYLIKNIEKISTINPLQCKFIESSSGNLGVALSIICKEKGYHFTCVTDPNISSANEQQMRLLGTTIVKVTDRDSAGGYLSTRIDYIKKLIHDDPSYIWTNQYANENNINAHYFETAKEIHNEIPNVDYLFVGAGTSGTLMGCAKYFKEHSPQTTIVAVDAVGSITFGHPPSKRYIPGIGTSKRPEILEESYIDEVILVPERDAVMMCHFLFEKYCLFLGGSTGSVMSAVKNYKNYRTKTPAIVAISPDFGSKYADTIYNKEWVLKHFNLSIN